MISLTASPLVAYLLHFAEPVGRSRHYLGSTMEHLLIKRLETHAKGRGARLTARAFASGTAVHLVDVWGLLSRADEHRLKRIGHYNRRCPVCSGLTKLENTTRVLPLLPTAADWIAVEFDCK